MALKFGQSRKGRRQYSTKKLPPTICRKVLLGSQYELVDQNVTAGKNSQQKGFVIASWIADKYFKQARNQTNNKYQLRPSKVERVHFSLGGAVRRHTSVGHVDRYTDMVGCVLVPVAVGRGTPWQASSSLRGPSPRL